MNIGDDRGHSGRRAEGHDWDTSCSRLVSARDFREDLISVSDKELVKYLEGGKIDKENHSAEVRR